VKRHHRSSNPRILSEGEHFDVANFTREHRVRAAPLAAGHPVSHAGKGRRAVVGIADAGPLRRQAPELRWIRQLRVRIRG
jgi:hypothetical protein